MQGLAPYPSRACGKGAAQQRTLWPQTLEINVTRKDPVVGSSSTACPQAISPRLVYGV